MRTADCLRTRLRQPEMLDLAFGDKFLDRASHVLGWHVGVHAMLVK